MNRTPAAETEGYMTYSYMTRISCAGTFERPKHSAMSQNPTAVPSSLHTSIYPGD